MTKENRTIWDSLKETDPRFTKRVNKGFGEITSIDPQWQIMKMTEQFGAVGDGWGYDVSYTPTDELIFAEVTVWTKSKEETHNAFGPVCSVQKLYRKTGALDDEAPKKAMTDALTKAFSHLGLSADVFLGLHDSSKYVNDLKKEIEAKASIVNKDKVKLVDNN